jgi:hypothetical protein
MPYHDTENNWFKIAAGLVNNSNRHVFLTGKAGTGKTTFLKFIQQETFKKTAVVAPTGVAAINAGGVTMHSFFQLPFGPYIPHSSGWNSQVTDSNSLLKNIRFNQNKRELLKELELLIIDEVSMVRADMLDAVDVICRHFRRQPYTPFGGLQVLYIGDLFQLPPVVNDEEWKNILSQHYKSPFFFDAKVMEQAPPVIIELKKIYRQDESSFINILNNIRNNTINESDLDTLHQHFDRNFEPSHGEAYITLTTHNSKADAINQQQLSKLKGKVYSFNAEIEGEFNEKSYPADKHLQLKTGAQVMFIKNDKGEFRRYYNGKIATVTRIDEDGIYVSADNNSNELLVEQETWRNIRYNYDKQNDKIDEEELGTFKQYPLRLAWAITIHKSQGLTFEKAIIDAGASFAPGQVYVALSRLTSLKGLVLFSRIHPNAIQTDQRVLQFVQQEMPEEQLQQFLEEEQKKFVSRSLIELYDWKTLTDKFQTFFEEYEDRLIPDKEKAIEWANEFSNALHAQKEVAEKFTNKLQEFLSVTDIDYTHLHKRTVDASAYFTGEIKKSLTSLRQHIDEIRIKKRTKKYLTELTELQLLLDRKEYRIKQSIALAEALAFGNDTNSLIDIVEAQRKEKVPVNISEEAVIKPSGSKPPKGESNRISLQMFKAGNNIAGIAKERGFAVSTIESHLASFIPTGEITLQELLSEQKINKIMQVIEELGDKLTGSKDVKDKLPADYSFADIKAVMLHLKKEKEMQ